MHSQEREGDVTVDLRLDGDFNLKVEVKTELQSRGRGNSLALRAADDLSTEDGGRLGGCELGLWGRHCWNEDFQQNWQVFYTRRALQRWVILLSSVFRYRAAWRPSLFQIKLTSEQPAVQGELGESRDGAEERTWRNLFLRGPKAVTNVM